MRIMAVFLMGFLLIPVVAVAQPAATPRGIVGVGSWGEVSAPRFPGALVRPDEAYAFVWWTGARPAGSTVQVEFRAAGGSATELRPADIACVVNVATVNRFDGPETLAVARIKLGAVAPEDAAPIPATGTLTATLVVVDWRGRMVPGTRQGSIELSGWFPRLTLVRWRGDAAALAARFAVLDADGKLAGFGVKFTGGPTGDGGAVFSLPQHECLPR